MLTVLCSKCGRILYRGTGYESENFVSPQDIIARNKGKCPKCGKPLDLGNAKITIRKNEAK